MARVYSTVLMKISFTSTAAKEFGSLYPPAGHVWVVRHIAVSGIEYATSFIRWAVGVYGPTNVGTPAVDTAWFAAGFAPSGGKVSEWEGRVPVAYGEALNAVAYVNTAPKPSCTMLVSGYDLGP